MNRWKRDYGGVSVREEHLRVLQLQPGPARARKDYKYDLSRKTEERAAAKATEYTFLHLSVMQFRHLALGSDDFREIHDLLFK